MPHYRSEVKIRIGEPQYTAGGAVKRAPQKDKMFTVWVDHEHGSAQVVGNMLRSQYPNLQWYKIIKTVNLSEPAGSNEPQAETGFSGLQIFGAVVGGILAILWGIIKFIDWWMRNSIER